jgi:hypothetical protein
MPNGTFENDWLIIHDLSQTIEYSPLTSVLELSTTLARSRGAFLYWSDPAAYELRLTSASSTTEDSRIHRVCLPFTPETKRWLEELSHPVVLLPGDARLAAFPCAPRAGDLLVLSLRRENDLAGVLTLSRADSAEWTAGEMETAQKLCGLVAVLMNDLGRQREVQLLRERLRSARQEIAGLEKRLEERKIVERAKGLLQLHHGWTEEDAYYHLRRTSRQERMPMAVIAQRVIDRCAVDPRPEAPLVWQLPQ